MELGAHLPLIDFGEGLMTAGELAAYARECAELGLTTLAANDHLVFARPWLDGLTALASVADASAGMTLMTTASLPVVRGPVQLAKALAGLDAISGGRLVAGLGPGSSPADHAAVGVDFTERWRRLDDAIATIRALWRGEPYDGRYYSATGIDLTPHPVRPGGPPIWIGSWRSPLGLRRVARLADGWLASAYHVTPAGFAEARDLLTEELRAAGRADLPNTVATMFVQVTSDLAEADRIVADHLAPALDRDPDELAARLAVGPPDVVVERLCRLRDAGAQRVLLWPVRDPRRQLELLQHGVLDALV